MKNRRGNILLIGNWPSDTGYAWWLMARYWATIADYAQSEDRCSFVWFPIVNTLPEAIACAPLNIAEMDMRDWRFRVAIRHLLWIRKRNITHVYLSDYPTWSVRYALLRLAGVKKVIVHDHTPGQRTPPVAFKRLLKVIANRTPGISADHVIAVTEYVRTRHLDVACIPLKKSLLVENGIEPIWPELGLRVKYRTEFRIPSNAIVIASTGRASRYKGIDFIIRCMRRVRNAGWDNVYMVHCGDGPDLAEFRQLAEGLGLTDRILFAGKRDDVRDVLQACDIGISASQGEVGYSLAILEYMSAGLATLVPDDPSTSMATVDGATGLVYRQGSEIDCSEKVMRICEDDSLRRLLGENAAAEVRARFDLRRSLAALREELPRILN